MQVDRQELVAQLKELRDEQTAKQQQPHRRSKLDSHKSELLLLHEEGASLGELARWLKRHTRKRANPTTLSRRLKFWLKQEDT